MADEPLVLRGIEKIAARVLVACGQDASGDRPRVVARSAQFQAGLAEVLRTIEDDDGALASMDEAHAANVSN